MRVLLFGAAGQLGVEFVRELAERGYEVKASDRAEVDITDAAQVEREVASFDAPIAINCAAYNQVDVAESDPQSAFLHNGLAVRNLAVACRQADVRLVHFSTDYVFDGTAGRPYTEEDPPRPLGAYAVSKLAGELYAQAYLDNPLIIRTSGVFGPGGLRTARGNFPELMLRLAKNGRPIQVVADHVASPTYAPWLAARTLDLVERNLSGVFHIGGGTPISWFNYAKLIFRTAGLDPELRPTSDREYRTAARRPKFSALSNGKMERAGIVPLRPLEEAVKQYFAAREDLIRGVRA